MDVLGWVLAFERGFVLFVKGYCEVSAPLDLAKDAFMIRLCLHLSEATFEGLVASILHLDIKKLFG